MRAFERIQCLVWILVPVMLMVAGPRPARAQTSPAGRQEQALGGPEDKWQRRLEIAGFVATLMNTGCGKGLRDRLERNDWEGYNAHRNWHIGLSAAAVGLNVASAWKQQEINRNRTRFEFRHAAHNALFWTNMAGLVSSGILGIVSEHKRTHGDPDGARRLGDAMRATSSVCLATALADVALFGGPDNATLVGFKITF